MTIPQSIIDKINKEYPEVKGLEWQDCHKKQREAAIWGYGLSEERIASIQIPKNPEDWRNIVLEKIKSGESIEDALNWANNDVLFPAYHANDCLQNRIKELEADIKRLEKIIEAIMRRVAAMAVCAMEQIETPKRCMVPNKEREFETSEVNKSEIF